MFFVKTPSLIRKMFYSLKWRVETNKKEVFISFDDSPTSEFTNWILNVLSSLKIKATFFCIGESAKKYPEIINKIQQEGHSIGNHSFSHKNGLFLSTNSYIEEIEKCSTVIPKTNLFRPPYGKIYPWQIREVKKKYNIIMWDVLSYDFKQDIRSKILQRNIIDNIESGSIIVFHDNKKSEQILKKNLEEILKKIKEKGYIFSKL